MSKKLTMLKPRLGTAPGRISTMQPGREQSSTQRGYGWKWQKARAKYLEANPLCTYCAREGKTVPATVLDHIIPHRGDQELFWRESNWAGLCSHCHQSTKQREEARLP